MRELETGIPDGEPDPVTAFTDGRIRQPDHRERWKAEGDVHLDLDRIRFDAEDRGAPQAGQHIEGSCKCRSSRFRAIWPMATDARMPVLLRGQSSSTAVSGYRK